MDIPNLVSEATHRAHRTLCVDQDACGGPTETEIMITANILESTIPRIMQSITQELRQALHAIAAGYPMPGEPDALGEDPEQLLGAWYLWWKDQALLLPAQDVHVRTAAYLAARSALQARA